jgi:hypothetical protein
VVTLRKTLGAKDERLILGGLGQFADWSMGANFVEVEFNRVPSHPFLSCVAIPRTVTESKLVK